MTRIAILKLFNILWVIILFAPLLAHAEVSAGKMVLYTPIYNFVISEIDDSVTSTL
jgi:hypothetical protein